MKGGGESGMELPVAKSKREAREEYVMTQKRAGPSHANRQRGAVHRDKCSLERVRVRTIKDMFE